MPLHPAEDEKISPALLAAKARDKKHQRVAQHLRDVPEGGLNA